ncbi:MAG: choline dehydrogenase [Rhodobacteraceae bacterium]|nr:choline dehydrogenase [Paracoccaceae bacterium]
MKVTGHDYIIIGAGSAGCVVANRLSRDPHCSVLLIEAGGHDRNPLVRLPMMMGKLFNSGLYNWSYHTEPVESLNGRSLYWPRGKVLGGSSTINGMIYVRGNRHDYDRWAQSGLSGWSYEDVLTSFTRSEMHRERRDMFHGQEGELAVCRARGSNPLFDVFVEAGKQAGYPANDDFNGAEQEGFGRFDFTIRNGKRWSAASAFLKPVRKRSNLTIMTGGHVSRIMIAGGKATGVEVVRGHHTDIINSGQEVIICAGTVNSPQLLMLSGVGPAEVLQPHGIEIVHEMAGVGRNLQDHVDCVLAYECTQPITLYRDLRADRLAWSIIKGLVAGQGMATTFPYEAGSFVKSRQGLVGSDIQMHFMPALEKTANLHFPNPFRKQSPAPDHGFSIRVGPVNPASRGSITLRSADPADPPAIHPGYLVSNSDRDAMIAGIRIVREVVRQPAFDRYRGKELQPGPDIQSEDQLITWLRQSAMTTFHPVGTCRMGSDRLSVVDERLRVHGLGCLRVADASVMPVITSGNTNAPAIMIGEQLAAFITDGQ